METKDVIIERLIEAFSTDALDFFGDNDTSSIDYYLLMKKLATEKFTLKDIPELSSRVFNHWKKNGLMPLEREKGRAQFSFIEFFWLRIVLILRDYGLPLEKIGVIRYCLFNPTLDPRIEYEEEHYQDYYQEKGSIDSNNILGVAIAMMVMTKEPVSIIIPPSRIAYVVKSNSISPHTYPFLSVPLMVVLRQYIRYTENIDMLSKAGILNEKETLILEQIRREDIKEVKIEYAEGKSKLLKVTSKKKQMIEREITNLMSIYGYENIVVNKHGKDFFCEITTNHKLK